MVRQEGSSIYDAGPTVKPEIVGRIRATATGWLWEITIKRRGQTTVLQAPAALDRESAVQAMQREVGALAGREATEEPCTTPSPVSLPESFSP